MMNAVPLSERAALKNLRNASKPPADAPIPTIARNASLPRPADGTLAAARAFRVEGRARRIGPIFVAWFRPRATRFIGSRQPAWCTARISWPGAVVREHPGASRRTTYVNARAQESGF